MGTEVALAAYEAVIAYEELTACRLYDAVCAVVVLIEFCENDDVIAYDAVPINNPDEEIAFITLPV